MIPGFQETLEKMNKIHISKNADYATGAGGKNAFFNFDFTYNILKFFKDDRDKTFVWPIACKLARLAILLSSPRKANNESIQDSLVDIANYCIIWKCDIDRRENEK